jgi:hypothetical protein
LVIGPVSSTVFSANGGFALNTCTFPASFSVIHTSSFSGVTAILGENGVACGSLFTI